MEPKSALGDPGAALGAALGSALRAVLEVAQADDPAEDQRGPLMTVEAAAHALGCGRTRVFALIQEGRLKRGRKAGRRTMVTRASIEALARTRVAPDLLKIPLGGAPKPGRRRGGG